jgi:hypothetical protein
MAYKTKLFNSLSLTKDARSAATDDESGLADLMANPEYLRHSSAVINDALKEGFDVLQLPNGDIVTTGTKIITNTYVWDAAKGKLSRARAAGEKPSGRKSKATPEAAAE